MRKISDDDKLSKGGRISVKTYNLDNLVEKIYRTVQSHLLPDGGYARWLWNTPASDRNLGVNEYGCADAANILYSIGRFPRHDDPARAKLVKALLDLRHEDGSFAEPTHHPIHTTAHCLAALDLFDAVPDQSELAPFLEPFRTKEGAYALLESLLWEKSPWSESHKGAGMFVCMNLTRAADMEWNDNYFRWLWDNTDERYGMSRMIGHQEGDAGNLPDETENTKPGSTAAQVSDHLFGWFHYMFNMECAHMPLRYPEKVVDTCLHLWRNRERNSLKKGFAHGVDFKEIDWVFVINRASRQTPHRWHEVKEALREFAAEFLPWMDTVDYTADDRFNDLHMLFGAVCALAELQAALPGEVRTTVPLKLVLDRRPFI